MKNKNSVRITLLGGDMRQTVAAGSLARAGYKVRAWNIPDFDTRKAKGVELCDNINDALSDADAVIFPLPSSTDGIKLNCGGRGDGDSVLLNDVLKMIPQDCLVIGGKLPEALKAKAIFMGMRFFDYFEDESFQIRNAYTTAEAAVSIAMNQLSKNIRDSELAVTGYGRIAKQLVSLLIGFGASVTVAARKDSDLAWASLKGCRTLRLGEEKSVNSLCNGYDIIFNTVPRQIFDSEFIESLCEDTLIIELASAPGGIDVAVAKGNKTKVLWAASLPGKYAPESAGTHIAESVCRILEQEGE